MELSDTHKIWIELADLFFLDTEPIDDDYSRVAQRLVAAQWTSEATFAFVIKYIAPTYANNIGQLIYPVIGEWAGFKPEDVVTQVQRSMNIRKNQPDWYFAISDWWYRRMLKKLDFHKLELQIQKISS